jgi:hypothetical protein
MLQAGLDFWDRRLGLQPDKHAAGKPLDTPVRKTVEESPDVLVKPGLKPSPVVSLEVDFVIVNHDCALHRLLLHVETGLLPVSAPEARLQSESCNSLLPEPATAGVKHLRIRHSSRSGSVPFRL